MLKTDSEVLNPSAMHRHWSPHCEAYASGDALVQALENGWQVSGVIFRQEVWLAGNRRTIIYHVTLTRDGTTQKMKMVYTPYISRLVQEMDVQVVRLNERKNTARERWSAV
jgi:hypothetical protein